MNLRAVLAALAALTVSCAIAGYALILRPVLDAATQVTGQVIPRTDPLPPAELDAAPPGDDTDSPPAPAESVPNASSPAELPPAPTLSGSRRINVLLLGSDTDAKFQGAYDSQIMILVSIDPATKQVSMLSLPRDLWVPIPGAGMGKLGTALMRGGVALTRETVERDFGIPIDYYAWVGLDGFVKVVDLFGGVDIDVMHPIVDNSYPDDVNTADPYAYRRLYIPAGPQHLDGIRALEYVRSRHGDQIGDFGRSQRQQQVLDSLRTKTSGRALIPKIPALVSDLKDSLRTDMTLLELAKLAAFADQLAPSSVQRYTLLPPRYSEAAFSADGQSIVVPEWQAVRLLVDQVFDLRTSLVSSAARRTSEQRTNTFSRADR